MKPKNNLNNFMINKAAKIHLALLRSTVLIFIWLTYSCDVLSMEDFLEGGFNKNRVTVLDIDTTPPEFILPENNSNQTGLHAQLVWAPKKSATNYQIEISENEQFS